MRVALFRAHFLEIGDHGCYNNTQNEPGRRDQR